MCDEYDRRLVELIAIFQSAKGADPLTAEDIANVVCWIASLPPHVNINRLELMPVSQSWAGFQVYPDHVPRRAMSRHEADAAALESSSVELNEWRNQVATKPDTVKTHGGSRAWLARIGLNANYTIGNPVDPLGPNPSART